MKTIYILFITLTLSLFTGCNEQPKAEKEAANEQEEHSQLGGIALTENQMRAVNIELGTIELRDLNSIVRVNGEMELEPQKKASINTLVGGIITQILVTEGKQVRLGQTLAYLENTEIVELQRRYLTTTKEALIAKQEYKRQTELLNQGAGIEKIFQQASANYEISKAQVVGLEKQLQQLSISPEQVSAGNMVTRIPIKAPISGTVNKINVTIGSFVDMQNSLMTISDNSQIHCDLKVFEKDLKLIKKGQEVDIILTNQPGTTLKGVIYEVNESFDSETKSFVVHATLKDKKGLKLFPGMYVTALINVGKQKTDAVPNESIISLEGKKYIFALEEEIIKDKQKVSHFKRIEVITGISELGYTQITLVSDLVKDAKIVKSGAFYIASMASEHGEH